MGMAFGRLHAPTTDASPSLIAFISFCNSGNSVILGTPYLIHRFLKDSFGFGTELSMVSRKFSQNSFNAIAFNVDVKSRASPAISYFVSNESRTRMLFSVMGRLPGSSW